ncbi:HEAT repeat domain-containing protein [Methylobacter sp. YRD-M1]|uniref:HEAT repeat domain-containing protein n=1 Tax=Methylobacter sp. YRD-M1 TaxID=2911520 RepID=UPI00227C5F5E|nr:HEAT repeat domain-containing protein [Methylobacter sp. YRD-M1]WAK02804.1 HEAT repeat domain-containing protein [Methylobacter sp. YRD-M1]
MKTIKTVIISAMIIGFISWLWPNLPSPVKEQTKREFDAANSSRAFAPPHSDSASDSVVQDKIPSNTSQPSNPPPFYVLFTSNHLSLASSSHPLQDIVDKITQQSGITIVMSEAIANPTTTLQFHDLSIEQGLHRLFENYDIFFFYTRDDGKSTRLATVWVYPQGRGKKFAPISPPIATLTNESIKDITDADSVKRATAITNLVEQQGSAATEIVKNALTDPDELIRIQTLDAALRAQIDLPLDTLTDLAQNDASAKIRSIALAGLFNRSANGLIGSSDILDALATAQKDDDPEVSELAAQLMQSLEETPTESNEQESQESQEQSMDP